MHYINSSYTTYSNRRKGRVGHLFRGRYKAIVVDADHCLLELSRYLHLNPVRAHLVEYPEEYLYSSYRSYIKREKEEIVHCDRIWEMISRDEKNGAKEYRRFVEGAIGKDLKSPLENVYGGIILGGEKFIQTMLNRIERKDFQKQDISYRRQLDRSSSIANRITS